MKPIFLSPYYRPWSRLIGYIRAWRINVRLDMSIERPANEFDVKASVRMSQISDICLN